MKGRCCGRSYGSIQRLKGISCTTLVTEDDGHAKVIEEDVPGEEGHVLLATSINNKALNELEFLIPRLSCKSHTFVAAFGEITLTLEDVA